MTSCPAPLHCTDLEEPETIFHVARTERRSAVHIDLKLPSRLFSAQISPSATPSSFFVAERDQVLEIVNGGGRRTGMAEGGGDGAVASRKLTVEVCSARNLMPKDGQGTSSAYAMVDFDGQRRRTKTRPRDLNPQWDERLEFLVHDPGAMAAETLEVNVYHDDKNKSGGQRRGTFLGRVRISGATFPKTGSESLVYYPLEKRSVFSQIKGEIGLKVCYDDEPAPAAEAAAAADAAAAAPAADAKTEEEKKEEGDGNKKAETAGEKKPPEGEAKEGDAKKKQEGEAAEKKPPAEEKKPEEKKKKAEGEQEKKAEEKAKPAAAKAEEKTAPKEKEKPPTQLADPALAVSSPSKISASVIGGSGGGGELGVRSLGAADRAGPASCDLVERVSYLFVRLLKAKHSAGDDRAVYAKVAIGTHSVRTRAAGKISPEAEWDQVFAFHKASLNSTALDISVWAEKKKDAPADATDTCLGAVSFDVHEIPKRCPPDSPLAPQWYNLEGAASTAAGNDVMLAAWVGTQVDEAFQEAWQSDSGGHLVHTRSKAYLSPKLWYLRLTVIQSQDLRISSGAGDPGKPRELYVKGQLGPQVFRTAKMASSSGSSSSGAGGPSWHEDLVFVAAEPFDPFLVISVEDAASGQAVGYAKVHISSVHRRTDDRSEAPSRPTPPCFPYLLRSLQSTIIEGVKLLAAVGTSSIPAMIAALITSRRTIVSSPPP
ncbi:hypothetical protein Taro_037901 [Colocasia esculenta]|uniref:C2 domain-containing protein n=1 Tax=Colocasia esculenta TaxID=4460 RepID=A0A843WB70_COLES|nr:hypothetical protein [Colocasia esculenta]